MRKWMILILAALAILCVGGPITAQETPPSSLAPFPEPGNRKIDGALIITGQLYKGTAQTDWIEWFPGFKACRGYESSGGTTMAPVQVAQFDYGLRGAANKTWLVGCSIDLPTRSTTSAGAKIVSVDLSYSITGANATTSTFNGIRSVSYATLTLNTISTFGGSITSGTWQTVSQVTPYLTSITFGTPAFVNTSGKAIIADWTFATGSSSVLTIYGMAVHYTRAD